MLDFLERIQPPDVRYSMRDVKFEDCTVYSPLTFPMFLSPEEGVAIVDVFSFFFCWVVGFLRCAFFI